LSDAPNNYPGGSGQNMDELDIQNAFFGSSAGSANIDVTLTIKNLQAPPTAANPNILSGLWTVYWQQAGTANAPGANTWWFAQATTSGTGHNAVATFSDGTFDVSADSYSARHTVTGAIHTGATGTVVRHVERDRREHHRSAGEARGLRVDEHNPGVLHAQAVEERRRLHHRHDGERGVRHGHPRGETHQQGDDHEHGLCDPDISDGSEYGEQQRDRDDNRHPVTNRGAKAETR